MALAERRVGALFLVKGKILPGGFDINTGTVTFDGDPNPVDDGYIDPAAPDITDASPRRHWLRTPTSTSSSRTRCPPTSPSLPCSATRSNVRGGATNSYTERELLRAPFSHALKGASMTDPAQLADLAINQPDVALIFEGGGMRNSYTAPMVVELLARNLNFGCVYGISAGSSHTVNYLVRDATRARASFVELVKYPRFGGWGSFLRGTGYFNSPLPLRRADRKRARRRPHGLDWDTFAANPAEMHIRGHGLGHRRDRRLDPRRCEGRPRPGTESACIVHHAPFHAAHHYRRAHLHGRRHGR